MVQQRKYGYIKGVKDERILKSLSMLPMLKNSQQKLANQFKMGATAGEVFDLRTVLNIPASQLPYDQAQLGSCTTVHHSLLFLMNSNS